MALAREIMGGGISAGAAASIAGNINSNLASAGSTNADATPVTTSTAIVTGADGTKGVILSSQAERRDSQLLINNSASSLKVYPPSGAAITVPGSGMGTVDAAYTLTTYATAVFTRLTSTQWTVVKGA